MSCVEGGCLSQNRYICKAMLAFCLLLLFFLSRAQADALEQLALLELGVLADPALEMRMQRLDERRKKPANLMRWVDETHAEWSEDISEVGGYLDGLMGAVENVQDDNKSYLKIDLDVYHSRFGDTEFDPRIRFRLDLPVLKEKFRLVFESEPDQAKELGERKLGSSPTTQASETNDNIYASFRYWIDAKEWSRLSFDSGVRVRVRPDIFSRMRGVRIWTMNDYWLFRFSQEVYWFESRGLGTQSQFDFDRHIKERFMFRKTIALDWSERDARYDLLNQFSLYQTIDEGKTLRYSVGMQSDYQQNQALARNYFASLIFRSRLYKDWLFYQFDTGVEYSKEYQFKANPFATIRLEIIFADDAEKKLRAALY